MATWVRAAALLSSPLTSLPHPFFRQRPDLPASLLHQPHTETPPRPWAATSLTPCSLSNTKLPQGSVKSEIQSRISLLTNLRYNPGFHRSSLTRLPLALPSPSSSICHSSAVPQTQRVSSCLRASALLLPPPGTRFPSPTRFAVSTASIIS